jgi:predicted DNA-binding ArsR family transcriptional regulator
MNNIIKNVSTTYEPETDSRDELNHKIAEQNKELMRAYTLISDLTKALSFKTDLSRELARRLDRLERIK